MSSRFSSSLLATAYMYMAGSALALSQGTLLFEFSSDSNTDIENAILRPNGQILMVPLSTNTVYNLDPSADSPEAVVVATLPGVDSVQGIASIGDDKYAVTAGVRGNVYSNETIFIIDLSTADANGTVTPETALTVADAENFNGLVSLPSDPNVLLIADSVLGAIWQVNLTASTAVQTISDDLMAAASSGYGPDLGIDGLKLYSDAATGQLYAYFTNVGQLLLARIPIAADGSAAAGAAEIVANQTGTDNWDDMAIAQDAGLVFGAMNPSYVNLINITSGASSIVANVSSDSGPTSVVLADDGSRGYVFTREGRVFEVTLPDY